MNILAIVNKFASFVPPVIWLTLVLVVGSGFLFNSWRLDNALKKLGAAEVAVRIAKGVNERNDVVVSGLKETNAACLDGRRIDEANFVAANADWRDERLRLSEVQAEIRINEIEIYRDPSCAELARLDISAVCPTLAYGLRQRADSLNRIRNDSGRGSGSNSDTGSTATPAPDVSFPAWQ